jgi:hypothetical protein
LARIVGVWAISKAWEIGLNLNISAL